MGVASQALESLCASKTDDSRAEAGDDWGGIAKVGLMAAVGKLQASIGNHEAAAQTILEAVNLVDTIKSGELDIEQMAELLCELSMALRVSGKYAEAMQHGMRGMDLLEEAIKKSEKRLEDENDGRLERLRMWAGKSRSALSILFLAQSKLEEAQAHAELAIKLLKHQAGDDAEQNLAVALNNMGNIHLQEKVGPLALSFVSFCV